MHILIGLHGSWGVHEKCLSNFVFSFGQWKQKVAKNACAKLFTPQMTTIEFILIAWFFSPTDFALLQPYWGINFSFDRVTAPTATTINGVRYKRRSLNCLDECTHQNCRGDGDLSFALTILNAHFAQCKNSQWDTEWQLATHVQCYSILLHTQNITYCIHRHSILKVERRLLNGK